jgi:hypothetical protein
MSELITSIAKMGYIEDAGVGQRIAVELDMSADSEECRHGYIKILLPQRYII